MYIPRQFRYRNLTGKPNEWTFTAGNRAQKREGVGRSRGIHINRLGMAAGSGLWPRVSHKSALSLIVAILINRDKKNFVSSPILIITESHTTKLVRGLVFLRLPRIRSILCAASVGVGQSTLGISPTSSGSARWWWWWRWWCFSTINDSYSMNSC